MKAFFLEKDLECIFSIFSMLSNLYLDLKGNLRQDMNKYINYIKKEYIENIYLDIENMITFIYIELREFLFTINEEGIKKANLTKFISENIKDDIINNKTLKSSKNSLILQNEIKTIERLKIIAKKFLKIFINLHQYDSHWPKKFMFSLDVSDLEKKNLETTTTIIKNTIESAKKKVERKLSCEIIKKINEIKNRWQINIKNFDIKDIIVNSKRK